MLLTGDGDGYTDSQLVGVQRKGDCGVLSPTSQTCIPPPTPVVQGAWRKRGQKDWKRQRKRITAARAFQRRAGPFARELTAEMTVQDPHKLKLLRNPPEDGGAAHNPPPSPAEELLSMYGCLERKTPYSSAMQPLGDNPSSSRSPYTHANTGSIKRAGI